MDADACLDCERICAACGYTISGGWEHETQPQPPGASHNVCRLVRATRPVVERLNIFFDHQYKHVVRYTLEQLLQAARGPLRDGDGNVLYGPLEPEGMRVDCVACWGQGLLPRLAQQWHAPPRFCTFCGGSGKRPAEQPPTMKRTPMNAERYA